MVSRREFVTGTGRAGLAMAMSSVFPGLAGAAAPSVHDYLDKALADRPLAAGSDASSLRKIIRDLGSPEIDVDRYFDSRQGEHLVKHSRLAVLYKDGMAAPVVDFWRAYGRGLVKQLHDVDSDHPWASYVPVSALRPENRHRTYPMMFQLHEKSDLLGESYGHAFVCAEDEVILIAPYAQGVPKDARPGGTMLAGLGRTPENVDWCWPIVQTAMAMFPVDRSRVYTTGFSHPGWMSTWFTLQHPEAFAGHMLNSHPWPYIWDFPSPALTEAATRIKMPFIDVVGLCDYGFVFPVTSAVNAMTRNGHDHDRTAEQAILRPNYWLGINDCAPVTLAQAQATKTLSLDRPERRIGMPLADPRVVTIDDTRHFIGDSPSRDGVVRTRWVGIDNVPHWPAGSYARIAWDFAKHFSRDPRNHASIWDGRTTPITPSLTMRS